MTDKPKLNYRAEAYRLSVIADVDKRAQEIQAALEDASDKYLLIRKVTEAIYNVAPHTSVNYIYKTDGTGGKNLVEIPVLFADVEPDDSYLKQCEQQAKVAIEAMRELL